MISLRIEEKPDPNWDKRLLKSDLATIYQTKEWASIVSNLGRKPLFLNFLNDRSEIIGQNLVIISSRLNKRTLMRKILKKILSEKMLKYSWSYGPIIFDKNYSSEIYGTLANFLILKKCKISGTEHPLSQGNILPFKNSFNVIKWSTFLIDLTKTKEELFKNIDKHSGQKNIERSKNRGVLIEEICEESLRDYVMLVNKAKKALEKETVDYDHVLLSWKLLKPLGYSGFLAKKDGKPIGGLLFSFLNGHIIEAGVVRSKEDTENNLYSQDLIKWKIIEWGVDNKMKYYNLAGVNPQPKSKKEEGILRYKKKWGGTKYDYWLMRS